MGILWLWTQMGRILRIPIPWLVRILRISRILRTPCLRIRIWSWILRTPLGWILWLSLQGILRIRIWPSLLVVNYDNLTKNDILAIFIPLLSFPTDTTARYITAT